jgi:hypothetical protein
LTRPAIVTPLLALLPALSGCLASVETEQYLMTEYGGDRQASTRIVRTTCGRVYNVIESKNRVLVWASPVTERAGEKCPGEPSTSPMAADVSFGLAADLALQRRAQSNCRVTGGRQLTSLHSEFTFSCG